MKTKKLIAGLVSAVAFASMSVSVIASAADLSVKISSAEAKAGEEFTLTVDLADIPATGINGCEFGITYDSSVVTVSSVELGALAKDVTSDEEGLPSPLEVNIEKDVISLMYALGTIDSKLYLSGSGTFLNIKGEVKDTAKVGDKSEFAVVPVDRAVTPGSTTSNADIVFGYMADDDKITKYSPSFTSGTVTVVSDGSDETTKPPVTETTPTTSDNGGNGTTAPTTSGNSGDGTTAPTTSGNSGDGTTATTKKTTEKKPATTRDIPVGKNYGDVNVSGDVNVADVVALNLYLLNPDENPLEDEGLANADCVRDNVIDAADGTILMNYVAELTDKAQLGK